MGIFDHAGYAREAMKSGLDVYCSEKTAKMVRLGGHRLNIIQDGRSFKIGTWRILPFATVHDCEGSLAFLMMNKENENFLYLTDSQYSPVRFAPLTALAIECNFQSDILSKNIINGSLPVVVGYRIRRSHFSLDTVIALLKANDLSQLREVHLLHLSAGNSDEEAMRKEIEQAIGIPVYVAKE